MIRTYSYSRDKNKSLSVHFKVSEFRSKDGSDTILINDDLISVLENLRAYLDNKYGISAMNINSGYRTPTHSVAVGGYSTDQHTKGNASDIHVKLKHGTKLNAKSICLALEDLSHQGGIGYINSTSVHVDIRGKKCWFDETNKEKTTQSWYSYWGIAKEVPKPVEVPKEDPKPIEQPVIEQPKEGTSSEPILKPVESDLPKDEQTPVLVPNIEEDKPVQVTEPKLSKLKTTLDLIKQFLENILIIFKGGK